MVISNQINEIGIKIPDSILTNVGTVKFHGVTITLVFSISSSIISINNTIIILLYYIPEKVIRTINAYVYYRTNWKKC